MPEILLPSSTSILSSSSTASSLLLYNHTGPQHALTRRKSLPLRRISTWLTRRISRQGLNVNATHDGVYGHTHHHIPNHTHNHTPNRYDDDYDYDGNEKIISSPQRRKTLAFNTNYDYEAEQEQARRTERDLAESYAAYCRAFTSAGLHQHHRQHGHKRKTWMMDGLIDQSSLEDEDSSDMQLHTVNVHAENEDDECVDEKGPRETSEPEVQPQLQPQPQQVLPVPPPQILTPSLYAEMRRAACDKKRARLRQRRLWSWSWFPHIRHRES